MKKVVVMAILLLSIGVNGFAQKTKGKAPAKKTASKGKSKGKVVKSKKGSKIKTSGEDELDVFTCYEGGGPCTFTILKGDTLVYTVNQNGKSFDMYVVANKFNAAALADYSWYTSAPDSRSGKVQVNALGLTKGAKYMFAISSGDTKLTDASTLWLSEKSYKEIAAGATGPGTKMSIDNAAEETFKSPEADESNVTVNYKGNQILLEGFAIENKKVGEAGRKELSYMNVSDNLLLLKADLAGGSMQLKEVRASSAR